jgi:hypothetical protein
MSRSVNAKDAAMNLGVDGLPRLHSQTNVDTNADTLPELSATDRDTQCPEYPH